MSAYFLKSLQLYCKLYCKNFQFLHIFFW